MPQRVQEQGDKNATLRMKLRTSLGEAICLFSKFELNACERYEVCKRVNVTKFAKRVNVKKSCGTLSNGTCQTRKLVSLLSKIKIKIDILTQKKNNCGNRSTVHYAESSL